MLLWAMSDRAFPRSFAHIEGLGVHTWRFVNAKGSSCFASYGPITRRTGYGR